MKEKMITRTITVCKCDVMFCDVETANVSVREIQFPVHKEHTREEIEKYLRNSYSDSKKRFVAVTGVAYETGLYGVDESVFLEIATRLPERG